jgi:hypothetical protein
MLPRFSLGIYPQKCKKQTQIVSAFTLTFRRTNLSLASCTSAELTSVSVHCKTQIKKLNLQTVEKANHLHSYLKILSLDSTPGANHGNVSGEASAKVQILNIVL